MSETLSSVVPPSGGPGKPVCVCGKPKRSAFHHFCDACFGLLPWATRTLLMRHASGTTSGKELHAKAVKWLGKHSTLNPEH